MTLRLKRRSDNDEKFEYEYKATLQQETFMFCPCLENAQTKLY